MIPPRIRPSRSHVLGLPVSAVDLEGAVCAAAEAVRTNARCRIAVVNANKYWLALRDPALRSFLEEADLVVAESSVVWAARVLGREGVRPAWGVALMERLLARGSEEGWSLYLLGAAEAVVQALAERVAERYPGINLAGMHHGYLDEATTARVRVDLATSQPDLLLVGMGSPRQEHFIASLDGSEAPRITLGVGGSFDVHAGLKPDAPPWVRGSGLEWAYRSLLNPRLLRRYLVQNPWFVGAVVRERLTGQTPRNRR